MNDASVVEVSHARNNFLTLVAQELIRYIDLAGETYQTNSINVRMLGEILVYVAQRAEVHYHKRLIYDIHQRVYWDV